MDYFIPAITALIGALSALVVARLTNKTATQHMASVAEQELRKDLILLHTENQKRIALLEKEMLDLREKNILFQEKNAELYELYLRERDKVAKLEQERDKVTNQLDSIMQEKAKLANQIIIMESEIRELRNRINGIE
jgi:chromosome segregation ATPase